MTGSKKKSASDLLGRTNRVHMVGIGGIGMSGIAEVLLTLGFTVSGSDRRISAITDRLQTLGATIYQGHRAAQVEGADVVVISSAIDNTNREVQEAREQKIPIIRRAEMLAELMRMKYGVAVAGTHGKTTTSSMIGHVMQEGELDPTLIIGGQLRSLSSNAKLGSSRYMVVEADEYDRSFLELSPSLAVITNIETEHLDCYRDLDEIKEAFVTFANKVPFYGAVFICLDEPALQEIIPQLKRRIVTYGMTPQAEVRGEDITYTEGETRFTVIKGDSILGEIRLHLPGRHNVKNSLAAVAVGLELEIPFTAVKKALEDFSGVHRRFEIKAVLGDVMIVDDYAHHPTEIKATLRGAREGWQRRVVVIFQPHLYSRTKEFHLDFGRSFFDADVLIVTDIYPAREKPIEGVSGGLVADAARSLGHRQVLYIPKKEDVAVRLKRMVQPGDLVITLGAGDVYKVGEELIDLMDR